MYNPPDDLERVIAHLRRPVRMDPALDARVLQQIAAVAPPKRTSAVAAAWQWLLTPQRIRLSPLAAFGIAAAIALVAFLRFRPHPLAPSALTWRGRMQFVVVAPQAKSVSLVGDFNDWDPQRTPMHMVRGNGGTWTAIVPLTPGRYRYAFLVNGSRWLADRTAPRAPDDEFGTPSSVVTVSGS